MGDLGTAKLGRLFYFDGSQLSEFLIGTNDRPLGLFLKGFGQDPAGELYVLGSTNIGPSGNAGQVLKITAVNTNQTANLSITSFVLTPDGLSLTLAGGAPPYLVQEKPTLDATNWSDVFTTTNLSATVPLTNTAGFFRVISGGTQAGP
jgi:hypothetical protein